MKTKIDELSQLDDDKDSDMGQSTDPLRHMEIFSAKSVDDSRASVYYTPTDGNTSPELQTSPIHINYINDSFDAPIIYNLRRGSTKNYYIDKKVNKFKFGMGSSSSGGGGGGSDDEKSMTGSLGEGARALSPRKKRKHERYGSGSYNPSLFAATEEDEFDVEPRTSQAASRWKYNESAAHENENLLEKPVSSEALEEREKKCEKLSKRLKNEYYYSLEDVVGVIGGPSKSNYTSTELVHDTATGKTNTLFNVKRKNSGNAGINSISLPEISNAKLVHGKHVILAIEDPDCHIVNNKNNYENTDQNNDSRL